jgi:hypothetical protein
LHPANANIPAAEIARIEIARVEVLTNRASIEYPLDYQAYRWQPRWQNYPIGAPGRNRENRLTAWSAN